MKLIHQLIRSLSVVIILTVALQTSFAAPRRPAKKQPNHSPKADRRAAKQTRNRAAEKSRLPRINRTERRRMEIRQRAEAARMAALERERAAQEALRERVQAMIAKDDATGEDLEIRRIALSALGQHAGTVVVMNPRTGQVYSMVNQQWALREGFKPCSTIKLVTGLAGLNEGVIDRQDTTTVSDGNRGSLTGALAHSRNEYFQTVGGRVGFTKMIEYARRLGLGEKTGINVSNETAGRVPQSKTGFAVNHMSSHGDDFKVTALQLATLVSAMSNGGKLLQPFVARAPRTAAAPRIRRIINIDSASFRGMLPGMIGAVSYGSGRKAFDPRETIAGKTGTCIEHGAWIGLFVSYAPVKDPELAVVVIGKGADGRGHFPVAVAGRIYRELNSRFGAGNAPVIASTNQQPAIADADSDEDDDEVDEAADHAKVDKAAQTDKSNQTIWGDQRRSSDSKVKATILTLPTRGRIVSSPSKEKLRRN